MAKYPCLRIWNVPSHITQDIQNISKNNEISRGVFLKPKIKMLIDRFPDEIKKGIEKEKNNQAITIPSLSDKTLQELQNIADFIGVDVSSLVKIELYMIIQQAPAHLKRAQLDY